MKVWNSPPPIIELLCLKNHRIRWYLSSQGEGQMSLDVNAWSRKGYGIYKRFRERQFVTFFFMIQGF